MFDNKKPSLFKVLGLLLVDIGCFALLLTLALHLGKLGIRLWH